VTVTAESSSITYVGDGTTDAFSFPYRFLENAHLRVLRIVIATGVETELTLDSGGADGFTATGAADPAGGAITAVTPPSTLQRLAIDLGNIPATQEQAYVPNTTLPAQTIEKALDKLTMLVQAARAGNIARVLRLVVGDTDGSGRYDANGNRIINGGDAVDPTDYATLQQVTSMSAGSFIAEGAGAVVREMQDKVREFVSVKDFDATGDGATDDSDAVQAAFDAHDNVYFPPGVYVVDDLTFAGKRLFGDGATLFWKDAAASPLLTISAGGAEIRGIKFDGNAAEQTITSSAIKCDGDQVSVIACEFRDFHGRVLTFNGENSLVAHSYFHDTGVAANCNCVELTNRGGMALGNRFINIGDGHVVRVGYQSVVRDCDGFIIANNFVQTTLHGTFTCELGANRGVIIGNTVDGADAAYKTETDASVYDVTIAFNTVMNLTDAGPIDLNATGVNYIGNRHYNLPNGGPFFGDLGRCEGNFFRDVGTMGVWTAGDRVDFINNTIIDPDVVLAGQIITVEGGCRVAGNRIVDTASDNLGIGVRAFGANNIIDGNSFVGLDQGVLLGTTCANSIVRNNHVTDCTNQAETVAGDGTNMVEGNFGFAGAIPVKVIASGVLTISPLNRNIRIGTEGGAATDDLDTISGGVVGQVIILGTASNSQDTTVKDGTGNIGLAGDFAMTTSGHRLVLEFNGTNWFELSRAAP
jgi:hypothetical protein